MTLKSEIDHNTMINNSKHFKHYTNLYNEAIENCNSNRTIANKRLNKILDKDSYFLELSNLAGYEIYDDLIDSGIITGIGLVSEKPCMILINNPEQKAGCYLPITIKKTIRALEIALKQKLPCIHIVDSAGAYLPLQTELFANSDGFGKIFFQQSQLKKLNIPQFAAILGSCTAGGAYIPVMADSCTMIKNKASLFLAGPPLVEIATGEKLTAQELGGSRVHCYASGVVDHESTTEQEAISWLRQSISRLGIKYKKPNYLDSNIQDDITAYINHDPRHLPDINGIISSLIDNSEFDEFQVNLGKNIRTGWGKIHGHQVAIIANDGVLTSDAMYKANKFIEISEACRTPLVFLHNTHGMLVGAHSEKSGIATHGARLIQKVANTELRKYTIMIGNSYGAGNYAMCGRAFSPDFLFQWPNNKTAVMGAIQQEFVMRNLGKELDIDNKHHGAIYHSARLNDDGIIEPNKTREILGFLLGLINLE